MQSTSAITAIPAEASAQRLMASARPVPTGILAAIWAVSLLIAAAVGAFLALPTMEDAPQLMALRSQAGAAMVAAPASAQVPAGLSTTRQADGLFYLTAQVNGKPVRFIVDTGASLVVLSKDDAARTGVQRGEVISATTANGATAMQRATIEQFDLAGRQLRDVRAIVAGQGDVSLIGQNVLAQMDRVVIEGTTLQLR